MIRARIRDATLRRESTERDKADRSRERTLERHHRQEEKRARDAVKIHERAEKERAKTVEKHHREARRAMDRAESERNRGRSGIMSGLGLGAFMAGGVGLIGAGAGALSGGLHLAGSVASGAADLSMAAMRRRAGLESAAIRLSIGGRMKGEKGVNHNELLGEAEAIAGSLKGSNAADILAGQGRYVTMTGDLAGARRFARTAATTALATGATSSDVASTMATMRDKFGITSDQEMQDAMAKLIQQGKTGSFEFSDAGAYFAEMGAAGNRFGLRGSKGVAEIGGLAQIARQNIGSGAEASTAVMTMFRQLIAKGADKGKLGVKALTGAEVFTDKTQTKARDIQDVLVDVIGGSMGNMGKLQEIFDVRGITAVSGLINAFNDAQGALGKGAKDSEKRAAGEKAVRDMLQKNINTQSTWSEVMTDATAAGKGMEASWDHIGETILATLGKSLAPLALTITKNLDSFMGPIKTAGSVVGVFSGALANFISTVGSKFFKDDSIGALSTDAAMERLGGNLNEMDELGRIEKKHGLSDRQMARKAELMGEQAELLQKVGSDKRMEEGYSDFLAKGGTDSYNDYIMRSDRILTERKDKGYASDVKNTDESLKGDAMKVIDKQKGGLRMVGDVSGANAALMTVAGLGDMFGESKGPSLWDSMDGPPDLGADDMKSAAGETKGAAKELISAAAMLKAMNAGIGVPGATPQN